MEKFEFGVGDDDRKKLVNFVDGLQAFIGKLIEDDEYFVGKFRDDYKLAWQELNPHFSVLKDAIKRADANMLLAQGLMGNQLALKLNAINHFAKEFKLYGTELIGGHKLLIKLFDAMDVLLNGIVVCSGSGASIAGFKDYLRLIVTDDS